MTLSYMLNNAPIKKLCDTDRAWLGMTNEDIMRVGVEFMSFKEQRPNTDEGGFLLTEKDLEGFAMFLSKKNWTWANDVVALLVGTEWSREV